MGSQEEQHSDLSMWSLLKPGTLFLRAVALKECAWLAGQMRRPNKNSVHSQDWIIVLFEVSCRTKDQGCNAQRNRDVHKCFCPQNLGRQPPPHEEGSNVGKLTKFSLKILTTPLSYPHFPEGSKNPNFVDRTVCGHLDFA